MFAPESLFWGAAKELRESNYKMDVWYIVGCSISGNYISTLGGGQARGKGSAGPGESTLFSGPHSAFFPL